MPNRNKKRAHIETLDVPTENIDEKSHPESVQAVRLRKRQERITQQQKDLEEQKQKKLKPEPDGESSLNVIDNKAHHAEKMDIVRDDAASEPVVILAEKGKRKRSAAAETAGCSSMDMEATEGREGAANQGSARGSGAGAATGAPVPSGTLHVGHDSSSIDSLPVAEQQPQLPMENWGEGGEDMPGSHSVIGGWQKSRAKLTDGDIEVSVYNESARGCGGDEVAAKASKSRGNGIGSSARLPVQPPKTVNRGKISPEQKLLLSLKTSSMEVIEV